MNFERCLQDHHELSRQLERYEEEGVIKPSVLAPAVAQAHLEKAEHNLSFAQTIIAERFNDWRITAFYYAVYHATLSLVCAKGYSCKHHTAAILFLMRHYGEGFTSDDYRLVEELHLSKEDAVFYYDLKEKRQQASYNTNTQFSPTIVEGFRERTIRYVQSCKALLEVKTR